MASERFDRAIARFDAANSEDPHREIDGGVEHPKELLYSRRMSERLRQFAPDASEPVRLAVHAQHLRRWTIPRGDYPPDRQGYRRWRVDLGAFHAEAAGEILRDVGYGDGSIARVQSLLRKERLKADPETQLVEDVACLVFLEHYFADFARGRTEEQLIDIVRKTWRKMSPRAHAAALELSLPPVVSRALDPDAAKGE